MSGCTNCTGEMTPEQEQNLFDGLWIGAFDDFRYLVFELAPEMGSQQEIDDAIDQVEMICKRIALRQVEHHKLRSHT